MAYYETSQMVPEKSKAFAAWFDREINTDREENEDSGLTYHFCSDLTASEVKRVREFEIKLLAQPTLEETEKACKELFGF